jgi:hypothetical protein
MAPEWADWKNCRRRAGAESLNQPFRAALSPGAAADLLVRLGV